MIMSLLRYTYYLKSINEEVTSYVALPDERSEQSDKVQPSVLLIAEKGKEADFFIRKYFLESCCRTEKHLAVVTIPHRILQQKDEKLQTLLSTEIPQTLAYLNLRLDAVWTADENERLKRLLDIDVSDARETDPIKYVTSI